MLPYLPGIPGREAGGDVFFWSRIIPATVSITGILGKAQM
jgi:hypothetical protein